MVNNNPVRRQNIEVDPMFSIPEGVDELLYSEDQVLEESFDSEVEEAEVTESEDTVYEEEYSDTLVTPDIVDIVDQFIRTTESGSQNVDVVFEVEDYNSGGTIQFKVARA